MSALSLFVFVLSLGTLFALAMIIRLVHVCLYESLILNPEHFAKVGSYARNTWLDRHAVTGRKILSVVVGFTIFTLWLQFRFVGLWNVFRLGAAFRSLAISGGVLIMLLAVYHFLSVWQCEQRLGVFSKQMEGEVRNAPAYRERQTEIDPNAETEMEPEG